MFKPLMLSTWSFGQSGHRAAWSELAAGGSSLDAVVAAATHVEDDPQVMTVGRGGLPDRDGQVSLDACVMQSPARCGAVAGVRGYAHVTALARQVMQRTEHAMLVGAGAEAFAESLGMTRENLLSQRAEQQWRQWLSERQVGDQPPPTLPRANYEEDFAPCDDPEALPHNRSHDTVGILGLDTQGVLAGACSTSGWAFKLPGRVGDSPVFGHGLYVDPTHGAAAATGTGELVMGVCGTFLAVELMRGGASPDDAAKAVLERIKESYELHVNHQVAIITLRPDGQWGHAALRPGYRTAVKSSTRDELVEAPAMLA